MDNYTYEELQKICRDNNLGKCGGRGVTKKVLYNRLNRLGALSKPRSRSPVRRSGSPVRRSRSPRRKACSKGKVIAHSGRCVKEDGVVAKREKIGIYAEERYIPKDIWFEIVLNTEIRDLRNLCKTNKEVQKVCRTDNFWKEKYKYEYGNYPKKNELKEFRESTTGRLIKVWSYEINEQITESGYFTGKSFYMLTDIRLYSDSAIVFPIPIIFLNLGDAKKFKNEEKLDESRIVRMPINSLQDEWVLIYSVGGKFEISGGKTKKEALDIAMNHPKLPWVRVHSDIWGTFINLKNMTHRGGKRNIYIYGISDKRYNPSIDSSYSEFINEHYYYLDYKKIY